VHVHDQLLVKTMTVIFVDQKVSDVTHPIQVQQSHLPKRIHWRDQTGRFAPADPLR
jgi:hypothetical protein